MHQQLGHETEPGKCSRCGTKVWVAKFGTRPDARVRQVELAPPTIGPSGGRHAALRPRGHISLSFPMAGTEAPILAAVTRRLTRYRVHKHSQLEIAAMKRQNEAAIVEARARLFGGVR